MCLLSKRAVILRQKSRVLILSSFQSTFCETPDRRAVRAFEKPEEQRQAELGGMRNHSATTPRPNLELTTTQKNHFRARICIHPPAWGRGEVEGNEEKTRKKITEIVVEGGGLGDSPVNKRGTALVIFLTRFATFVFFKCRRHRVYKRP